MQLSRHSTFRDLVVVVAEFRGTAEPVTDAGQGVPVDPFEAQRCAELVQRGWQRVVQSWSHWEWKKRSIIVKVKSGDSTIRMPWFFNGKVYGHALYEHPGPSAQITLVSQRLFHEARLSPGNGGWPTIGTFERNQDDGITGAGTEAYWNLRLHPESNGDYNLRMLIECEPKALWDLDDRHYAGPDYDRLVRLSVQAEVELDINRSAGEYDNLFRGELANAIRRSSEVNRESLGRLEPTASSDMLYVRGQPTISLNGVTIL